MPKKEHGNIVLIRQILKSAENSIKSAQKLLDEVEAPPKDSKGSPEDLQEKATHLSVMDGGKIVEGVFDGQNMVGPDGRIFPIPANYASKSKLVEGDILKLTIEDDGSFVFKQIGPVERKKLIGDVIKEEGGEFRVQVEDKSFKVLLASITYFKAEAGDEITIVVPKDKECTWAAVENVIKKTRTDSSETEPTDEDIEDVDKEFKPVDIESEEDEFKEIGADEEESEENDNKDKLDEEIDKNI
ncbi:hypothetical protein KKC60_01465 [Patescibacteria group bacterium]|nr:hypothetical protein [Patescibacteria group bacterium]